MSLSTSSSLSFPLCSFSLIQHLDRDTESLPVSLMGGLAMYLQSGCNGGFHSPSLPFFPLSFASLSHSLPSHYGTIVLFSPQVSADVHIRPQSDERCMGFLTSKGKREEEQMREHGCEWGGVWEHKQTHRETQSVLAEYVCFFSRSFFFFSFFCGGCLCCNGAPLGSFWASLMGPLH